MYSGVGGSTVLYAGDWPRLTPSDFRVRSLDGVADDWPLTYEELEPALRPHRAPRRRGGLRGRPGLPAGRRPAAAAAAARARRAWTSCARTTASAGTGGRRRARSSRRRTTAATPCAQWGSCMQGCPEGAKASSDVGALAAGDRARGARAHRRARRRGCCSAPAGSLTGAEYVDAEGRDGARRGRRRGARRERDRHGAAAAAVGERAFPDGLANSSGLVGRRLMMHPFAVATGVFDERSRRGAATSARASTRCSSTRPTRRRGFVRGAKWSLAPSTGGPMNAAMPARAGAAVWGARAPRARARALRPLPELGHLRRGPARPRQPRHARSGRSSTPPGMPAPRVTYRASENSRRLLDFHVARARRVAARAAGATQRRHASR